MAIPQAQGVGPARDMIGWAAATCRAAFLIVRGLVGFRNPSADRDPEPLTETIR